MSECYRPLIVCCALTMRTLLSRIISPFGPARGFVYVPDTEEGLMQGATAGSIIRKVDQRPPWIVVHQSVESVIVAKWPGKLLKVEIIEAAPEQPNSTALYTRATAVRVLEEQPASQLFGPHGVVVCKVVKKAETLELNDVQALGESISPLIQDAYSRAWDKWLTHVDSNSTHRGGSRSPLGAGFTVLSSVLANRARDLVGDAAFVIDDEDEVSFTPDWASACSALSGAAMAYGAPELLSPADRDLLLSAWVGTFGELTEK